MLASGVQLLLVVAHLRPGSFNQVLAAHMAEVAHDLGWRVLLHDLYRAGFDPALPPTETYTSGVGAAGLLSGPADPLVQRYRTDLAASDALAVVHPTGGASRPR